jgi:hypothetical protein
VKSPVFATCLAALALGGVGVLYLKLDHLTDDLRSLQRQPGERVVIAGGEPAAPAPSAPRPARPRAVPETAPAPADPEPPATLEERVARLEQRQAELKEATDRSPARYLPRHAFARTVDHLARSLKLTLAQQTRVADAIERGKRQIEDILKIPDETGRSPHERRQERRKKMREALAKKDTGGLVAFATDLFSYRGRQIPGRNATYGEEIDRIKQETRDEIASTLDAEQQETFAETNIDPLLGEGGAMAFSVVHAAGDEGEGSEVLVEAGTTVIEDTEDPPADRKPDD